MASRDTGVRRGFYPLSRAEARAWAQVGVLSALALVLGYVETFIPLPIPVPGVKLGLANIAVLVALVTLDVRSAVAVAAAKVLAAGFLFGNPLMMAYSAGGTLLAFAVMAFLTRISGISVIPTAIAGAILHNIGQLAVASLFLGTTAVWAALPPLVVAACVTGALSGAAARYTIDCLEGMPDIRALKRDSAKARFTPTWEEGKSPCAGTDSERVPVRERRFSAKSPLGNEKCPECRSLTGTLGKSVVPEQGVSAFRSQTGTSGSTLPNRDDAPQGGATKEARATAPIQGSRHLDARVKALALAAYVAAALHATSPTALALCAAMALGAAAAARLQVRDVAKAQRPLVVILLFTAVFQMLFIQQGTVLFTVGPVAVTVEALAAAGRMLIVLSCILAASIAFMHGTPTGDLVGMLRWLLSPFRAVGVRTEAFMFALSVAFAFVPVLANDFLQLKRAQEARAGAFSGGTRQKLAAYTRLFAPLVRSAFLRASRLADAAISRGLGCGPTPTRLHVPQMQSRDYAFLAAALALTAILLVI